MWYMTELFFFLIINDNESHNVYTCILYFLPLPSEVCSWRIGICLTLIHFSIREILERFHKDQLRGIFKTHKHKHMTVLANNPAKQIPVYICAISSNDRSTDQSTTN